MSDDSEKTFEPTQKKLDDARKKGQGASAPELRHAAMFTAALIVTGGLGAWSVAQMIGLFIKLWGDANDFVLEDHGAQLFASTLGTQIVLAMLPLFGVLVLFALLTSLSQGMPSMNWARLKIKWDKLSPMAGFKRLFGMQAFVEYLKTLAKVAAVFILAWMILRPRIGEIVTTVGADAGTIGTISTALVFQLVKAITLLVAAIAIVDFVYQRRAFLKKMMMSLQEIKDEMKDAEGNPEIKAKVRQIQRQRAQRRMMAAVPDATVIVTNPTHYSVALKYDHGKMGAPVVVAKGVDTVALKIREIAREAKVPILESPPLARALYAQADIDQPIPAEHYAAVAEIIGYVMRLMRRQTMA